MAVTFGVDVLDENAATIDNVDIEIYDNNNTLVASGKSGDTSPGRVEFSLSGSPAGTRYNIRAYQVNTGSLYAPILAYADKKSTIVYEPVLPGVPNNAVLTNNSGALACSVDPNCCRITARVNKHNCTNFAGYVFYVRTRQIPRTIHSPTVGGLQGTLLGGDRITLRTDKYGIAIFDLPRNGYYSAQLPDYIDETIIPFVVPDAPCADFSDLLFLYPKCADYDNTSPSVAAGQTVEVKVTKFLMSDDRSETIDGCVYYPTQYTDPVVTSGDNFAEATWKEGTMDTILITGLSPGTATIQLVTKDPSEVALPVRLPKAPIIQTTITVTVT